MGKYRQKGFVQIPLIVIGLLVVTAVALPLVTNLVSKRVTTQQKATGLSDFCKLPDPVLTLNPSGSVNCGGLVSLSVAPMGIPSQCGPVEYRFRHDATKFGSTNPWDLLLGPIGGEWHTGTSANVAYSINFAIESNPPRSVGNDEVFGYLVKNNRRIQVQARIKPEGSTNYIYSNYTSAEIGVNGCPQVPDKTQGVVENPNTGLVLASCDLGFHNCDNIWKNGCESLSICGSGATPTPVPGTGTIQGTVFEDLNGNGVKNTNEPGVNGARVDLANIGQAVTDGSGFFVFQGLAPGNYTVTRINPPDFESTTPDDWQIRVNAGITMTVDFGSRRITPTSAPTNTPTSTPTPAVGSIEGSVWEDIDGNGVINGIESYLPSMPVELYNSREVKLTEARTGVDGSFRFTNVAPGQYFAKVVAGPGAEVTFPGSGGIWNIQVVRGVVFSSVNFGVRLISSPTATPLPTDIPTQKPTPTSGSVVISPPVCEPKTSGFTSGDLITWKSEFFSPVGVPQADYNCNRIVDLMDLEILRRGMNPLPTVTPTTAIEPTATPLPPTATPIPTVCPVCPKYTSKTPGSEPGGTTCKVTVNWNTVSGAIGFKAYRNNNVFNITSGGAATYTFHYVPCNNNSLYKIVPQGASGCPALSCPAFACTVPGGPCQ